MTEREEAVRMCMTFADAYEDHPFHDANWTVMRHGGNHKLFACIFSYQGRMRMNLKVEPMHADLLQAAYPAVVPAYHMNKRHWVGVVLDDSLSDECILAMIAESHTLTK